MLITHAQVDELLSQLSDLSGLDEELMERCGVLIRSERYDEAVGRAFVVLEERLRESLALRMGTGVRMSLEAFEPETGQLVERLNLPRGEVEGIRDLFVGAFRAFRNRAAHTVAGYGLDEARSIIYLVNLLLMVLERARQAPTERVPQKVAEALAPAATDRLRLFLDSLRSIGIRRGQGRGLIPYQATLEYKAPSWKASKPHAVTVFYLYAQKGKPIVAFNSKMLTLVVGLDIEPLEADLLQAGCTRTVAKQTPIKLFLSERNDQATFDRLYEILGGLMEKHRV